MFLNVKIDSLKGDKEEYEKKLYYWTTEDPQSQLMLVLLGLFIVLNHPKNLTMFMG